MSSRRNSMKAAVLGGAGFIGSHLVDALIARGHPVLNIDNLHCRVHPDGIAPNYLNPRAEFVQADVRDQLLLNRLMDDVDVAFYLAGVVGVAESMTRIRHYTDVNLIGFSNFLEIAAQKQHLRKLILSSSVTVYGEGAYSCARHGLSFPDSRTPDQIQRRSWELICRAKNGTVWCGRPLTPLATSENKPTKPLSVYAVTKLAQEDLALAVSRACGLSVTVLRYFNVYGPRQALSNPYTGVAKIFAAALSQGNRPVIYEDGAQMRDFVHVNDVVQANLLALESDAARGEVFNVGTGLPTKVGELAEAIGAVFGTSVPLEASGMYRAGDVRHCWADISKIRSVLGFTPKIRCPVGLKDVLGCPPQTTNILPHCSRPSLVRSQRAR